VTAMLNIKQRYARRLVRLDRYGMSGLLNHIVFANTDKSRLDNLPKTELAKIIANYDFKDGDTWWYLSCGKNLE